MKYVLMTLGGDAGVLDRAQAELAKRLDEHFGVRALNVVVRGCVNMSEPDFQIASVCMLARVLFMQRYLRPRPEIVAAAADKLRATLWSAYATQDLLASAGLLTNRLSFLRGDAPMSSAMPAIVKLKKQLHAMHSVMNNDRSPFAKLSPGVPNYEFIDLTNGNDPDTFVITDYRIQEIEQTG